MLVGSRLGRCDHVHQSLVAVDVRLASAEDVQVRPVDEQDFGRCGYYCM